MAVEWVYWRAGDLVLWKAVMWDVLMACDWAACWVVLRVDLLVGDSVYNWADSTAESWDDN